MREVDPNEQLDEDVEEVGSNPWKGLQKELIWDLSQISGPLSKEGALVHLTPVFPCSLQPSLFFCISVPKRLLKQQLQLQQRPMKSTPLSGVLDTTIQERSKAIRGCPKEALEMGKDQEGPQEERLKALGVFSWSRGR